MMRKVLAFVFWGAVTATSAQQNGAYHPPCGSQVVHERAGHEWPAYAMGMARMSARSESLESGSTGCVVGDGLSEAEIPVVFHVMHVGSAYGFIGYPGNSAYCASKFGLRGFSEALYREMNGLGLKVIYAAPRAIDTPMNDARVVGLNTELGNHADSPSVVAEAIIRQIESESHRSVMGAPEAFFAKLNGFLPRLVDWALMKKAETVRTWAILPNKE